MGNLVRPCITWLLVSVNNAFTTAAGNGHRGNFSIKMPLINSGIGPTQRLNRIGILVFPAKVIFIGATLGKVAHGNALISILQAVVLHMVQHLGTAKTVPLTTLRNQIGSATHTFHTTGHHQPGLA